MYVGILIRNIFYNTHDRSSRFLPIPRSSNWVHISIYNIHPHPTHIFSVYIPPQYDLNIFPFIIGGNFNHPCGTLLIMTGMVISSRILSSITTLSFLMIILLLSIEVFTVAAQLTFLRHLVTLDLTIIGNPREYLQQWSYLYCFFLEQSPSSYTSFQAS